MNALVEALENALALEPHPLELDDESKQRNFEFVIKLKHDAAVPEKEPTAAAAVVEFANSLCHWKDEIGELLQGVARASPGAPTRRAVKSFMTPFAHLLMNASTRSLVNVVAPCLSFLAARSSPTPYDFPAVYASAHARLSNAISVVVDSVGNAMDAFDATYLNLDESNARLSVPTAVFIVAGDDKLSLSVLAAITDRVDFDRLGSVLVAATGGVDPSDLLIPCYPNSMASQSYWSFMRAATRQTVFLARGPAHESYARAIASLSTAFSSSEFDLFKERCYAMLPFHVPYHNDYSLSSAAVVVPRACLAEMDMADAGAFLEKAKQILRTRSQSEFAESFSQFCFLCATSRTAVGSLASLEIPLEFSASVVELHAFSPRGLLVPELTSEEFVNGLSGLVERQLRSDTKRLWHSARRFLSVDADAFAHSWKPRLATLRRILNETLDSRVGALGMLDGDAERLRRAAKAAISDAARCCSSIDRSRAVALVVWLQEGPEQSARVFARRFNALHDIDPFSTLFDFEDELRKAYSGPAVDAVEYESSEHRFDHPSVDERTRSVLEPVRTHQDRAYMCSSPVALAPGRPFASVVFWTENPHA